MESVTNVRLTPAFQSKSLRDQLDQLGISTTGHERHLTLENGTLAAPISVNQIFTDEWAADARHQENYIRVMSKVNAQENADNISRAYRYLFVLKLPLHKQNSYFK